MPYDIRRTSRCGENEWGLFLDKQGQDEELIACHTTTSEAEDQIAAIESGKTMIRDLLVSPTFKSIKDLDDKGTFGEYLIVFGNKEEHDLEGDYFTKDTEHWLDIANNKSAVLYGHGMDEIFGTKRLDKEGATLKQDDTGIWLETQLQRRNEYEEMVHELAKRGKLGLSSGTATHLVEREKVSEKGNKTIHEIKKWPLGLDSTLTPTPAEPRVSKVRPIEDSPQKSIKQVARDVLGVSISEMESKVDDTSVLSNFEGTKASQEEIDERYEEFYDTVNMSASEVENWGEKECADKASVNPNEVRNRVIGLLRTDKEDWGDKEYEDAGRVISFISRMKGVDGGEKPSEDCPPKREISLMNWAYDPTKSVASITKKIDRINRSLKGKFNIGDLVAWEGGDAQGRIEEVVGEDDTVSPSTTSRQFSGNPDEDGYLIELVDYDEEEDEVVGRDETVFHLENTLTKISKEDVKTFGEHGQSKVLEEVTSSLDSLNEKIQRIS